MLQTIRDNIKGRTAKVILGIIIVPFVFFGIGSLVDDGGPPIVLEINGEEVNQAQFQQQLISYRRGLTARMGKDIDYAQLSDEKLAPQVLKILTEKTLIEQAVRVMNIRAPEAMVNSMITEMDAFQIDGRFSNDQMARALADQGRNLAMLQDQLATALRINQLQTGIGMSNFSLDFNNQLLLDIYNETREINWIKLPIVDITKNTVVSDQDVESYYNSHLSDYQSELLVTLEYLELNAENLTEPVSDEDVEQEYKNRLANFVSGENRNVSHILLEVNDEQTKESALNRLLKIKERLAAGEKFSELAVEYSQDVGSAKEGGSLGYTKKDDSYPKNFEHAIFSLALNEVSEPVETDAGLHLVTVTDIEAIEFPELEELRPTIFNQIQSRRVRERYVLLREQLKDIAFNAADLEEPGRLLDLQVKQTIAVGRSGVPSLGASQPESSPLLADGRVLQAAFSDQVYNEGLNSDVLELSSNRSVVVRIKEIFQPRQLTLTEVSKGINDIVLREKSFATLAKIVDKISQNINDENGLEEQARQAGYTASVGTKVTRRSTEVDSSFLRTVFETPRSVIETKQVLDMVADSGDAYLFQLIKVGVGDADTGQYREALERQAQMFAGRQDLEAFMKELNAKAEISQF